MQINITRKNAGISDSLRTYVESKLEGLEKRYDKVIDAQVMMDDVQRENFVEISLHISGVTLFAKDESTNLRAAFDSCIDKLDKQLIKKKERMRRKSLTQEEAILSGKVIVDEEPETGTEPEAPVEIGRPVITFAQDDDLEQPEERTGT